jgi:hypothetical protein
VKQRDRETDIETEKSDRMRGRDYTKVKERLRVRKCVCGREGDELSRKKGKEEKERERMRQTK